MDRVSRPLLEKVFHDGSLSQALFPVGLYLLLHLLRLRVPDVLAESFELLVAFDHLVFEFSDLLLQRHHQEGLLLVLLRGLRKRKQALVRVRRRALGVRLLNELVVAEQVLDGFLLLNFLLHLHGRRLRFRLPFPLQWGRNEAMEERVRKV